LLMIDRHGADHIVIWKADLKGAFTLLKFQPQGTPLFASQLSNGLVYFSTWGNFGWCCMGFAFEVVTRILRFILHRILRTVLDMYVDDLFVVSTRDNFFFFFYFQCLFTKRAWTWQQVQRDPYNSLSEQEIMG
jgi:hypothetical protein